jgi:large subunit ribosomal protein L29
MAKVREIRDLGDAELLERLESDKEELFNLRFQLATGQLDNPMRIKQVRHEVARILTVLRERELEEEAESIEVAAVGGVPSDEAPGGDVTNAEGPKKRSLLRRKEEER